MVLVACLHDMYFAGSIYLAPYGLVLVLLVFWTFGARPYWEASAGDTEGAVTESGGRDTGVHPGSVLRHARAKLLLSVQNPLLSTVMAMFLVSVAQRIGSSTLERVVILLVLVGMMQATIGVLYRGGSGRWLLQLTILALCALGLSQVVVILQDVGMLPGGFFFDSRGFLPPHLQDWLWILGLLLILSAIYFAGTEAGDTRKKLVVEHSQLLSEVNERRRAEDELRKSEERFRTLIENCSDVIAVLDASGTFLYVAASVTPILGYTPDDLTGKRLLDLCHPDDRRMIAQRMRRIAQARGGLPQGTEVRVRHRNGSWRVMEGVGRNLLSDPVLHGIVINARDVTERKRMAERLEIIRAEEQQRIRHDLHDTVGQDLTGLLCMAGSLTKRLQNGALGAPEQAEAILQGVRHTMEDVRRAIQGIAPVEAAPGGLEVALRQLADKAKAQYEIEVRFDCQTPVALGSQIAATQLFRIAQEALTNAAKHARANHVHLSLLSDGNRFVVVIEDDGVGIASRDNGDVGMGLHTMRSRAAAIGATLHISEGDGGNGTRVECMLHKDRIAPNPEERGAHDDEA